MPCRRETNDFGLTDNGLLISDYFFIEELRGLRGTLGLPGTVAPFRAWRGSRDLVARSPKFHASALALRECLFSLTPVCVAIKCLQFPSTILDFTNRTTHGVTLRTTPNLIRLLLSLCVHYSFSRLEFLPNRLASARSGSQVRAPAPGRFTGGPPHVTRDTTPARTCRGGIS